MKKKSNEPSGELADALDLLFGKVDDLSSDELSISLADAGIDVAAVQKRLYDRVSELRGQLWEKNAEVTSDITSLLSQLRPADMPTSDPRKAAGAAVTWLRNLTERKVPPGPIEFAAAARNLRGKLSEHDRHVIEELEQQVRDEQANDRGD